MKKFVDPELDILRIRIEDVLTESNDGTGVELPGVPATPVG